MSPTATEVLTLTFILFQWKALVPSLAEFLALNYHIAPAYSSVEGGRVRLGNYSSLLF
jgi:hypothetical protein